MRQLHPAQPATQLTRWPTPASQPHAMQPLPFTQELSALEAPLYAGTSTRAQSDSALDYSQAMNLPRSGHTYPSRSEALDLAAPSRFSLPQARGRGGDPHAIWQLQQQLHEPLLRPANEPGVYMRPHRQEQGTQAQPNAAPTSTADALTSLHDFL